MPDFHSAASDQRPSGRIFLDANATTRPYPEVVETIAHHLRQSYANPGSRHAEGRRARRALEESREKLAALLGALPGEVVFTSGGTEASNMALFGLAQGVPGAIALTDGEHPATMESVRVLCQRGWRLRSIGVDSAGLIRPEHVAALPWEDVRLASVILAHNETGVLQDLGELARRCAERGAALHVDAVQAVGKIPVHFHQLEAAALSLGAHKFHGPRGIGALLVRDGVRLVPQSFGGHQEAGRRAGTEPVALAAGMARALEICLTDLDARMTRQRARRDELQSALLATCDPAVVNGHREQRLPNTLNISFPGVDGEALLVALDLEGLACSLGSTCASGSAEPAPVLLAMQCPREVTLSAVRFSLSAETTPEEVVEAARRIALVVGRLRGRP